MFCSSCGADGQAANAFCKRCGDWLPEFKRRSSAFGGETPQQNIFTGLFMSALSAVVALFSAIALYATYLGSDDAKWSVYLAAGFCLCIAGWQASSFFITLRLLRRLRHGREGLTTPMERSKTKTAHALNPGDLSAFVGVTSVTENSTELLDEIRSPERDTRR